MLVKRNSMSLGLLVAAFVSITCTGCLTDPKDGQNIGVTVMPFRAAGYFPNIYQTNPNIVLQAYNYGTGQWEQVAQGWFWGPPRVKDGNWYYPWQNAAVFIGVHKYWQYDASVALWKAKFRAYDLTSKIALPPTDDATLNITSNQDHVRLYAYF